jgi:hypothetical protein
MKPVWGFSEVQNSKISAAITGKIDVRAANES